MNYSSTRDGSKSVPSSVCLLKGISSDGGLFVPQSFPTLSLAQKPQYLKIPSVDLHKRTSPRCILAEYAFDLYNTGKNNANQFC